jgi:hypothetical protein
MELVVFNKKVQAMRKGEAVIRVDATSGVIYFSMEAQRALNIKVGDKIEFAHDKSNKTDWFFFKHNHPEAFELVDKKDGTGLKIQSTVTARAILDGIGIQAKSCGFKFIMTPQQIGDFSCFMIINKSAFGKKINKQ